MNETTTGRSPRRVLRTTALALFLLAGALGTGWCATAVARDLVPGRAGDVLALLFAATVTGGAVAAWRARAWRSFGATVVPVVAAVVFSWLGLAPSNERDWLPEVAVLPTAEVRHSEITLKNVRNFQWKSHDEYDLRYEDRKVDVDRLRTVDLIVSHWGSKAIAHTIVSFGFEGDEYLAVSIETRKEKGETFSEVGGLFRQFELAYVVADERDIIRVRTNVRNEDVYLYRLAHSPAEARQIFMDYVERINRLHDEPEFYNALTNNCTTNFFGHNHAGAPRNPAFAYEAILSGYCDELFWREGVIASKLPFEELKERSNINAVARSLPPDDAFSRRLRENLPTVAEPAEAIGATQ